MQVCLRVMVQAAGGSGWSAGLGSNLGWALSSFGGAKAKGQICFFFCICMGLASPAGLSGDPQHVLLIARVTP